MKPTYTFEEIVAMVIHLDREGLDVLCEVVNPEQIRYHIHQWVMMQALVDFRYHVIQYEEVRTLNRHD